MCWCVPVCEGVKRIVGWNVVNVHISIYITQHNTPLIEMQLFVRIKLPWPRHNVHFFNINTTTLAEVNMASQKKRCKYYHKFYSNVKDRWTKQPRLIMNLGLHELLSVKEAN